MAQNLNMWSPSFPMNFSSKCILHWVFVHSWWFWWMEVKRHVQSHGWWYWTNHWWRHVKSWPEFIMSFYIGILWINATFRMVDASSNRRALLSLNWTRSDSTLREDLPIWRHRRRSMKKWSLLLWFISKQMGLNALKRCCAKLKKWFERSCLEKLALFLWRVFEKVGWILFRLIRVQSYQSMLDQTSNGR